MSKAKAEKINTDPVVNSPLKLERIMFCQILQDLLVTHANKAEINTTIGKFSSGGGGIGITIHGITVDGDGNIVPVAQVEATNE
jgi:hypothetical protein